MYIDDMNNPLLEEGVDREPTTEKLEEIEISSVITEDDQGFDSDYRSDLRKKVFEILQTFPCFLCSLLGLCKSAEQKFQG